MTGIKYYPAFLSTGLGAVANAGKTMALTLTILISHPMFSYLFLSVNHGISNFAENNFQVWNYRWVRETGIEESRYPRGNLCLPGIGVRMKTGGIHYLLEVYLTPDFLLPLNAHPIRAYCLVAACCDGEIRCNDPVNLIPTS